MQTRSGEFLIKEIDAAKREVVGVISTNAIDRYHEVVEPSGVRLDNYRKNPVVLLNHNSFGLPIGKNLWIKSEGNGLIARTKFAETALGDDVLALYEQGVMKAWSIGFMPIKWEDGSETVRRRFTEWELLEYSAVTIPANPEAVTNALSIVHSSEIRSALEHEMDIIGLRQEIAELVRASETSRELEERIKSLASRIDDIELMSSVYSRLMANDGDDDGSDDDEDEAPAKEQHAVQEVPITNSHTPVHPSPGMSARDLQVLVTRTVAETLGALGLKAGNR